VRKVSDKFHLALPVIGASSSSEPGAIFGATVLRGRPK